ncbi:hypothetical protein MNB_SV-14-952 [hydrothermal vent metagenome]|uniref:Transcriptional regulator n=1 Tax=hydrothermal vent metagenome TaxID=652676 RepID=A0A1W1CPI5_9ZZZZ
MTEPSLIKQICKDYNFTYKELSKELGYSESAIKTAISTNKISNSMKRAIELFIENKELKEKVSSFSSFRENLRNFIEPDNLKG